MDDGYSSDYLDGFRTVELNIGIVVDDNDKGFTDEYDDTGRK